MLVRVLGPLVLQAADGAEVPVASTRQRRLLAALTLRAGTDTDTGELVELVWGVDPPDDPAGALQTLVARLRRLLPDPARIGTGRHSYRFAVPAGSVDAELFAAHLERARDATARDRLAGWTPRSRSGGAGRTPSWTTRRSSPRWRGSRGCTRWRGSNGRPRCWSWADRARLRPRCSRSSWPSRCARGPRPC